MADRIDIDISVILHATEDPERFFAAFAEYGLARDDFEATHHAGHFENPITVISARLRGRAAAAFVGRMARRMEDEQFRTVLDGIEEAEPDGAFYMRLDRQGFVQGRPELEQGNPVRIRMLAHTYGRSDARDSYRRLLESSRESEDGRSS
jgi:RNA binding exosome subunit